MSDQKPDSPETAVNPQDQEFKPSGNRPANNANLATPGAVNQSWEASDHATDFLGLGDELGGPAPAPVAETPAQVPAPMPAPAPAQAAEPEAEADQSWLMKTQQEEPAGDSLVVSDGDEDEAEEPSDVDSESVHASWVEDENPAPVKSQLPRIAAGLLVGVVGMTAVFVIRSRGGEVPEGVPLTPESNRTASFQRDLAAPGTVSDMPVPLDIELASVGGSEEFAPETSFDESASADSSFESGSAESEVAGALEPQGTQLEPEVAVAGLVPDWGTGADDESSEFSDETTWSDDEPAEQTARIGSFEGLLAAVSDSAEQSEMDAESLELVGDEGAEAAWSPDELADSEELVSGEFETGDLEAVEDFEPLAAVEEQAPSWMTRSEGAELTAALEEMEAESLADAEQFELEPDMEPDLELGLEPEVTQDTTPVLALETEVAEGFEPTEFVEPVETVEVGEPVDFSEVAQTAGTSEWSVEDDALAPVEVEELAEATPELDAETLPDAEHAEHTEHTEHAEEVAEAEDFESAPEPVEPGTSVAAEPTPAAEPASEVATAVLESESEEAETPIEQAVELALAADAEVLEEAEATEVEVGTDTVSDTASDTAETTFGPVLPSGVDLAELESSTPAVDRSAVRTRTTRLDSSEVLLGSGNDQMRTPTTAELKGIWMEKTVPTQAIAGTHKVLTPMVGRVRAVLTGDEIFEGTLYSVGEGRIVLDTKYGRMGLDGARIVSLAQLDVPVEPAIGEAEAREENGIGKRVSATTPGGTLFGRILARDGEKTTLATDDGARVTLPSSSVKLVNESPVVALRRAEDPVSEESAEEAPADEPAETPAETSGAESDQTPEPEATEEPEAELSEAEQEALEEWEATGSPDFNS